MNLDPVVFRPRRLRVVVIVFTLALCALVVVFWVALPGEIRALFTPSQLVTLLLFLALLILVIVSAAASYVRADDQGLRFRNGLRTHSVSWDQVHKIILRRGDPWAMLLLKPADGRPFEADIDADKRQLMGIQAHDGEIATAAVTELRRRLAAR